MGGADRGPGYPLRRWLAIPLPLLLAALLLGAALRPALAPAAVDVAPWSVQVWRTAPASGGHGGSWLARGPDLSFGPLQDGGLPALVVDPGSRYQRIAGFGGAFNERGWAALLLLSPARRQAVVRALFDPVRGAGYSLARTPIGASDYALDAYALDETPGDRALRHFSIARDRLLLLPYIHAALAVAPQLAIWASPWSAPAWMKSNNSMVHGGRLLPEDQPAYARYLADYVRAYAREGVPIVALSVQNEPSQSTKYPSMVMPAAQMARFVAANLGPLFRRLGLRTAIRINEEPSRARWSYSLAVLADPGVRAFVAGSDIHGYHGAPQDLARLHAAAPDLDIWQTEDMHLDHPHYEYADAPRWAAEIAGDLQGWASGWDFWNMVTDETGLSSWGWQQDAVVVVDTARGLARLTPKYYALAHFSRFIRPGAVRIGLHGLPPGLIGTAALDPDGRRVLVLVNTAGRPARFVIVEGAHRAATSLPAGAIATFVWSAGPP